MDDLGGILAGSYGFRPQGKAAPMAGSKTATTSAFDLGSRSVRVSGARSRSDWDSSDSWLDDHDRDRSRSDPNPAVDSILEGFGNSGAKSSMPVFDKPLYDEEDGDVFEGVPGMKSSSSSAPFDVFESMASGNGRVSSPSRPPQYEDFLDNLGGRMQESKGAESNRAGGGKKQDVNEFDDLIPGFGQSSAPLRRKSPEITEQQSTFVKPTDITEDPFIVLESASNSGPSSSGLYTDPLDQLGRSMNSRNAKVGTSSVSGGIFSEADVFSGLQNSMPSFKKETDENRTEIHSNDALNNSSRHQFSGKESSRKTSAHASDDILPKTQALKSSNSQKTAARNGFHNSETYGRNTMEDQSPKSEQFETMNDAWLTVFEIPLYTEPTNAPPPSRSPPPLGIRQTSFGDNTNTKNNKSFMQPNHSSFKAKGSVQKPIISPIDDLEDFAMGKPHMYAQDHAESASKEEESQANLAAAAMKEAMDKAEAKFKHAKEVREREAKSKEFMQQETDEKARVLDQELEDDGRKERLNWEQERKEEEEREKEQKRVQRERELELERQKARQAVERATREARERAAAEARQKAERAAVEKAAAEARQRAERAAVQRAAAEARERAAAEARERTAAEAREKEAREKAAFEAQKRADREKAEKIAVERVAAEARLRAERAAFERAATEARERAAAGAREKVAASTRERQQKAEDDLDSIFGMGSRATSAPKARATTVESMFDGQTQNKSVPDGTKRSSSTSSSNMRKASSTANIADDLSSLFGGPPSSGDFQEIDGETEERRRARLDRHQRTLERAAKALAEKNERDLQAQREQAERHRMAETLDIEIKRWAAGREGNLRALLSTLQYILWPECGWQPVSLTDMITGAAVKKVYRKATLCIHPDKVQQKGANLQQKYIAEKVFDLLKEAWNKLNSEELF